MKAEGQRADLAPQGMEALLTDRLSCVDVDDKPGGLVPTQDLVLSWKRNTEVMAMPSGQSGVQPGTRGIRANYGWSEQRGGLAGGDLHAAWPGVAGPGTWGTQEQVWHQAKGLHVHTHHIKGMHTHFICVPRMQVQTHFSTQCTASTPLCNAATHT